MTHVDPWRRPDLDHAIGPGHSTPWSAATPWRETVRANRVSAASAT